MCGKEYRMYSYVWLRLSVCGGEVKGMEGCERMRKGIAGCGEYVGWCVDVWGI